MNAESVLLEPWYEFVMELPPEQIGRGLADVQRMQGEFEDPLIMDERAVLKGRAPVSEMMDYQKELWSYTGGRGRLRLKLAGYQPCHNAQQVIEECGYDADSDTDNPSGSIFCAHGAGFFVPWDQVPGYMHVKDPLLESVPDPLPEADSPGKEQGRKSSSYLDISYEEDKELREIFEREFGPRERKKPGYRSSGTRRVFEAQTPAVIPDRSRTRGKDSKEYLLVDGYNMIFAWEELADLSRSSMDAARNKLMDILCNYQGYVGCVLILVFDAYRVEGNQREVFQFHNIHVVYTREAETADQYIEKTTHELGRKHQVRVATSDALEQVIIMGQGAQRISAEDFFEEIELVNSKIQEFNREKNRKGRNYLFDDMDEELAKHLEQVRLGKKTYGHIED